MIYALLYAIGFFVTWVLVTRHIAAEEDDPIAAVCCGLIAACLWPFVLLGFGVWRLANPNSTKGIK